MAANQLRVKFYPAEGAAGIPLEDVETTLNHIRRAVRAAVWGLGGGDTKARGRAPRWVVEQSALKALAASQGSFVIDLELAERREQADLAERDYGPRALEAILGWKGPGDLTVPVDAAGHLESIKKRLSAHVAWVHLTDWSDQGDVVLYSRKREPYAPRPRKRKRSGEFEPARAHGHLLEVNWRERTAQLHPSRLFPSERYIPLRFEEGFDDIMLRYAKKFVTVAGRARFTEDDEFDVFHVEEVIPDRGNKPFSKEEFERSLAKTPPYDPERAVTVSEPFDVMEFIRSIHEARDFHRE